MGIVLLLILGGFPIIIGIYLLKKIEDQIPHGALTEYRDSNGNPVLDENGKPMFVDERGKLFGYETSLKHIQRKERNSKHQWFICGCILGILSAISERKNRRYR